MGWCLRVGTISKDSWVLATQKPGWYQRWSQGSCKAKQLCTLQQVTITRSASQMLARYFHGAAMAGVSRVLGTQRTSMCRRWLQGCRANGWCMSQLAHITQSAPQQTALCSLGDLAFMHSWVLAMMNPIDCC